jgi:hypothetical protein
VWCTFRECRVASRSSRVALQAVDRIAWQPAGESQRVLHLRPIGGDMRCRRVQRDHFSSGHRQRHADALFEFVSVGRRQLVTKVDGPMQTCGGFAVAAATCRPASLAQSWLGDRMCDNSARRRAFRRHLARQVGRRYRRPATGAAEGNATSGDAKRLHGQLDRNGSQFVARVNKAPIGRSVFKYDAKPPRLEN